MKRVSVPQLLLLLSVFPIVAPWSAEPPEWKIVTKQNFSSLIRTHPHALLVVTLPWSGEARSVMKDIADSVRHQKEEPLRSLELLFMYKNVEKMLAGALGALDETTVVYYHHSTSYKYRGRLRASNILSSVLPYLMIGPDDISLKHLKSEEELKDFLRSTDRGVLLLEFCGWTPKLMNKIGNSSAHVGFASTGNLTATGADVVKNKISTGRCGNHDKSLESGFMQCRIENEANEIPWLGEVNSFSYGTSEVGEMASSDSSCNFEEFQRFETFFSKFVTSMREFFLPSERQKFGIISERALITPLKIGKLDSWSVSVQHAGCPSCSKIIHDIDDLKSLLLDDGGVVLNLEDNGHNIEPALPANKPSILLFVDRSSNSSKTQIKSKEALHALRELALQNRIPTEGHKLTYKNLGKPSLKTFASTGGASGHPTFRLYSSQRKIRDKMSVVIVNGNDGKVEEITSDIQGSSLHEVFKYLLQQKSEAKLSSLAKKAGFELLSDDMKVELSDSLPAKTPHEPVHGVLEDSGKVLRSQIDREEHQVADVNDLAAPENKENMESIVLEPLELADKYKDVVGVSKMPKEPEFEDLVTINEQANQVAEEDESSYDTDELGKQIYLRGFHGSFYFCDGDNQLLWALTGRSKIPSLVIVDPMLQQHYVFSDEEDINYNALVNYLNLYLNNSLVPYQKSQSSIPAQKDAVRPPFVNLDFHEADAIPRIAAEAFSKLLQDMWSEYGGIHAPQKDVLVLFSNNWCGFCQRMELIVREVFRAFKGYSALLTHQAENRGVLPSISIRQRLPLIYMMDCTLNDCSQILNSVNQREVYPALVLFPAQNKVAASYAGDVAVAPIIKFIATQGSYSHLYLNQNGILWTILGKQGQSPEFSEKHPSTRDDEEDPEGNQSVHEVLLGNRIVLERTVKHKWVVPHETNAAEQKVESRLVVGSILMARDKLLGSHPFDKSMIIIVKVDTNSGFQGLIINKPISWDSINELAKGIEIVKEAPLSLGGPLIQQRFPLVALTQKVIGDSHPEVVPGVFFLNQSATMEVIEEIKSGEALVTDYWFFLGFSSWSWGQLFDEIAEGAWTISDHSTIEFQWPASAT
ncbi:hypothetical protein MLD38_017598 [Melastoma candidum]|uniref:Uncharacterized protein n=1 Tax=Melastoma candidum TaxID=119954 RepID=A0ACB9QS92_9MYRT|nr:hypothetical protein MLD38_017598 [Melastoma candidum]